MCRNLIWGYIILHAAREFKMHFQRFTKFMAARASHIKRNRNKDKKNSLKQFISIY